MTQDLLIVENLGKKLNHTNVLTNVSFTLQTGQSMVIRGESGCGKTTLLRCLALLEPIDQGRIIFNGQTVSKRSQTKRAFGTDRLEIGMVFQQLYLWSHMTVLQNVALPLYLQNGKNKKLADDTAKTQLANLGIDHKAQDYPSQLSGGQRQRVALARALVHSPKILLLDEITASLDPETADKVMEIIEKIAASGTSIVLITHTQIHPTFASQVLSFNGTEWIVNGSA
jgi:ABC-type polar amino acid transport system ATPase subunit